MLVVAVGVVVVGFESSAMFARVCVLSESHLKIKTRSLEELLTLGSFAWLSLPLLWLGRRMICMIAALCLSQYRSMLFNLFIVAFTYAWRIHLLNS